MWNSLLSFLVVFCLIIFFLYQYQFFSSSQASAENQTEFFKAQLQMIQTLKEQYNFSNERILNCMAKIKRHRFIPIELRSSCDPYGDHPCPIGYGQTISQPYIVAYMTDKINPQPKEKILEIGTGSGYQAAVLAELGALVFSIEIIPDLAKHAAKVLKDEGYSQVEILSGDGYKGWPEKAPFDAIIVTCAPENIPQELTTQLKEGGRMILPVGVGFQRLIILRKTSGKIQAEEDLPVRFVPMVHQNH